MKTTEHFEQHLREDRQYLRREWCERVLADPLYREVQPDGRIRFWGIVEEFGGRYLRVVTLEDGETVHTAFFDRGFGRRWRRREDPLRS